MFPRIEKLTPETDRTVLNDPYARQADNNSSSHPSNPKSDLDAESLNLSDPLPWKDRPVDIYNPTRYNDEGHHVLPAFPPGLATGNEYIYSLAQQPKPTERSMDALERWWNTDARAEHLSQAQLDHYDQVQQQSIITPNRRSMTSSFDSLSSPSITRTGSGMAPIGYERSAQAPIGSERAAARQTTGAYTEMDNEGLGDLFKQVIVNLHGYKADVENKKEEYFAKHFKGEIPEWCIDRSSTGNDSFFGDWGSPPSRVGRDPRYRPTFHEGRYTVFEPMDNRGGREPVSRRLR